MKKLLVILSLILALCICLTSCNMGKNDKADSDDVQANVSDKTNDKDNKDPEGNKGGNKDSKQAIIDAFAKAGNLEGLFDELQSNVDMEISVEEVYAEILKMQTEASFDFNATIDGVAGRVDGYLGTNNGEMVVNFGVNAENGFSESATGYGKFTEDMKFVLATTASGSTGYETQVIDFGQYLNLDEMMGDLEDAADGSMASMISDFKLPELTKNEIIEKDGKYVISKDYWKKVVDYTLDFYIETMKDSGAEIDEEEFAEIKEMAESVLDNVKFDLFFRMNGSKFVGFGIDVDVTASDLEEILGEQADDSFVSASLKFDVKAKGDYIEYVDLDVNVVVNAETNEGMDCEFRMESIFDGDKLAGFELVEEATVTSVYYRSSYDDNDNYIGEIREVSVVNVEAEGTLDLRKADKAGSDVFTFAMNVSQNRNGEVDTQVNMNANVQAKGDNAFDYTFSYTDAESSDDNVNAYGSFQFSEKAENMPSIPSSAYDAMDEAIENYVPGQGGILGGMGRPEAAPEDNWVEGEKIPA